MERLVALLVALLLAGPAAACSCAFAQLGNAEAQAARHVFVFRLMDARVDQTTPADSSYSVLGTIKVVAQVRGTTTARQIRYSYFYCCGSRLEVGKYYIAFLPSDSRRFDGNAGNILGPVDSFGQEQADRLEAVLRGKKDIEKEFAYGLAEINQIRPPPPPCPGQVKKAR